MDTNGAAKDRDGRLIYVRTIVNQSTSEIEDIASMYAALGKKSGISRVVATNAYAEARGVPADSSLSVSEMLDGVKDYFSDVLSEDVVSKLGIERIHSEFTDNLRYQQRDLDQIAPMGKCKKQCEFAYYGI